MGLREILTAFLLFVFIIPVSAQEYSYARYDVKDGLAGSVVYHGLEDKDGFLWFATETGVSRFDGTHFKNFTTQDGLPDNEILRLFVDSKNRVWMRPFRNSICYYWKGKIYNQQNDSLLKRLRLTSEITDIAEDLAGNILITENSSAYVITPQGKIVNAINGQVKNLSIVKTGMRNDGNFGIISNIDKGIASILNLDPQTFAVKRESTPYRPAFFHLSWMSPELKIFNSDDSIFFLSDADKRRTAYPRTTLIKNVSPLNDSLCTINAVDGVTIFDFRKGKVINHCLQGKIVNAALLDREGNYWFMTSGLGIYRVGSFQFVNYTFNLNKDALCVYSVYKAGAHVYVGTEESVLWKVESGSGKKEYNYLYGKAAFARPVSIISFNKGLVLGTDLGLLLISHTGKRMKHSELTSVKSISVYKGNLLVSSNNGIFIVNDSLGLNNVLWHGRSTACFAVQDTIYVGTLMGMFVVNATRQGLFLGDRIPLFNSRIAAINASPDGTLWVATNGNGLIGYRDGQITHHMLQKDGLTSNICRTLFISGDDIWVGTDKGLNRLQRQANGYEITTYTTTDGLLADIVNSVYVDGSQLYVGTPAGLTTFDANKISLNSFCKLHITDILVAGRERIMDSVEFSLPPRDNAIRFDYVGISYRSAGDIIYRYRLVGLNEAWQTTRETFLSYPSLPSGDYELQVKATNKYGVESDMIRIPFRVEKLLWEKTWVRIIALIIAWVLIWLFVHARIKRVRRQNDEKLQINNRMAELEQMALKAQMNPHFIFNSLNSVQQYVIDKDVLGANKFITEFSRLIRLTLDISSKTRINIYEEISYLATYLELEKTKFEDKFSYSVVAAPDIATFDLFIPPMILQPYVENSIRHGVRYRNDKEGHIRVSFSLDQQYLICQVEDNGVGRKKAGQYKSEIPIEYQSKGMTLTAKRIEMLNKSSVTPVLIEIEDLAINNIPAGTRVTLWFPLESASRIT